MHLTRLVHVLSKQAGVAQVQVYPTASPVSEDSCKMSPKVRCKHWHFQFQQPLRQWILRQGTLQADNSVHATLCAHHPNLERFCKAVQVSRKCVAPPGRSLGSAIRRTPLSRRSQRRHLCRIIKYRLPAWVSQAVVTSRDQCDHPLCNRSVPIWNRKPAAAETCSAYFDGWHWCVAQNALAFLRLSLSKVYKQAMQKAAHASSSHVPGTGAPCHLCWAISHPPS